MENLRWDILGLGCTAVDDLLYVAAYPPVDAKAHVLHQERHCGGLTATALVAAARLGARAAFGGALGGDDLSHFVLERLAGEGVDVTPTVRVELARPAHSIIVVDEKRGTRNIFVSLDSVVGADPNLPDPALIRSAKVLFIDYVGMDGAIRAAGIAHQAGIPVVADIEGDESPRFAELLALVDHLIISQDFAEKIAGLTEPAACVKALSGPGRAAVVVTCGRQGCWYSDGSPGDHPRHQPAFQVRAVDTTGCGDVFHGAYAAALARGVPLVERIRFAAAAAALKATRRGGQAGIPDRAAVETLLKGQPA